ncbi:MAG: OmpH family outer membrane protein [Kordiimonadaceae bacterium]|nr:OmpH family outer membrane protein [Kordiimonadaceae bacterium]MBT6033936.1 OmpH family outer membrane protein [Kordiimonadaceae bacterium]
MIKNSKLNIIFTIVLAVISASLFTSVSNAQTIPTTKLAVVDSTLIASNSAVAKDIKRQVAALQGEMQTELTTKELALKTEDDAIKAQAAILPPEALQQKREVFQIKVLDYQRDVQIKSRQLEVAIANANAAVERELKPIFQSVLQTTGATMLMDKTIVIEQVPGLDVTTMIIEMLDLSLPSVLVELPPAPDLAQAGVVPAAN